MLVFFATMFLILPFLNYWGLSWKFGLPWYLPHRVIAAISNPERVWLATTLIVGIGLAGIRRWGWWLFLVSSIGFVVYNAVMFCVYPIGPNRGAVLHTLAVLCALGYFLRRDIFPPYLARYRRGWRLLKRYPIQAKARVNDAEYTTTNISLGGFYALWPDCNLKPNSDVKIVLDLEGEHFESRGGIAIVNGGKGVGISFRGWSEPDRRRLRKAIRRHFADKTLYPEAN